MTSFALQVAKWAEKAGVNMDTVVRRLSVELFSRVIARSPVDEGTFLGNWQVAIGRVPTGILEIDDKTGIATIAKATAVAMGLKAGEVIYLVNNDPIGPALEYGYSDKAPQGMVRVTIEEAPAIARRIAESVNK